MVKILILLSLLLLAVPAFAVDSDEAYMHYALAGKYMTGTDVPQDDKLAASELRKASDLGLAIAQFYLAKAYESGKGLMQDKTEAYFWALLAARGGDKFILDYRDELQKQLSDEQVVETQRRASAWRPSAAAPASP